MIFTIFHQDLLNEEERQARLKYYSSIAGYEINDEEQVRKWKAGAPKNIVLSDSILSSHVELSNKFKKIND